MAYVLVVDDDDEVRGILDTILKREGHEVAVAASAREARQFLATRSADLLLVDIDMPEETGVELVMELRQREQYAQTPVVFVTAYPERSRPLQSTKLGANAVIQKPFRMTDVRRVIGQFVGKRGETSWSPA